MVILCQLQGEDKMGKISKKYVIGIFNESLEEILKSNFGYTLDEFYSFCEAVKKIRTKNDEKLLSQIHYLVEQNRKIKLKLKHYLDTYEEYGVVCLPKYEIERMLDGDLDE